jgi:hypothetical protein
MADPLNGVYKARQSPRFAVGRTPSDARPGKANCALKARVERMTAGREAIRQDPRYWRPEEIGSGLCAGAGAYAAALAAIGRGSTPCAL